MIRFQPYWFDDAIQQEGLESRTSLTHDMRADVCIVGGGFTGLWTAIKIKQKQPEQDVVIIEKDLCGQGASGRNGGCMLTFSTKFPSLVAHFGLQEGIRLVKASEQAVFEIDDFCRQYNIDAQVRPHGAVYTASAPAQLNSLDKPLRFLQTHNLNSWQQVEQSSLAECTGSFAHLRGIYSRFGGSVHPGKLVRGLARIAESMGVKIYENTPLQGFQSSDNVTISTNKANIVAKRLVFATNAWTPRLLPQFSNSVMLISSDMVISQADSAYSNSEHAFDGAAVADSRLFVHYYRNTPDGRIMLGKGGNHVSYANKVTALFDAPSKIESTLRTSLNHFFPALQKPIERSWTGASDRSVTGLPFFGRLPSTKNVFYGFGYSGNGVVQSYLGGEFLSSLTLGLDNEWTRSGMAKGVQHQFPFEPIRSIGAFIVKQAVKRKERREDKDLHPHIWDVKLAELANTMGKSG